MEVLKRLENIPWLLPLHSESEHVLSKTKPPTEFVTGAFVLAFKGEKILLTKVDARGWDIPGGHIEKGESPEQTMVRELFEETGAKLDSFELLGFEKITVKSPKPDNYKYPYPVSYLVFFVGTVGEIEEFHADYETSEIQFFAPSEIEGVSWFENHAELFQKAMETL